MTDHPIIQPERAAIAALLTDERLRRDVEASLGELERLLETAGGEAVLRLMQSRPQPDPRSYLGRGKMRELRRLCRENGVTLVVFDDELTPSQIRNIEDDLAIEDKDAEPLPPDGEEPLEMKKSEAAETDSQSNGENGSDRDEKRTIRVIDRSMLILDIFALHAKTAEGKLQVELAQLHYTVPRLIGKGLALSRQQGGNIAMRGPGESKLESDKRHVKRRMNALEEQLEELKKRREIQRRSRDRSGLPKAAIVGYTNAGKSTLLNRLTDAGILAEDKLFATLDPTTRKFTLPSGNELLLVDTVGFIRNLPTHLIEAFRSTLDEVVYADFLLLMTDASDPESMSQLRVTEGLLHDLGCENKPILYLYNKCDLDADALPSLPDNAERENILFLSAKTGEGIDALVNRLEALAAAGTKRLTFRFPLSRASELIAKAHRAATVEDVRYDEEGATVVAVCDERAEGLFAEWKN